MQELSKTVFRSVAGLIANWRISVRKSVSLSVMLLSLFFVFACGSDNQQYGTLKPHPDHIPLTAPNGEASAFNGQYELIDHNGQSADQQRFAGRVSIIYFGFTSCPDVCPFALGRLSAALDELDRQTRDSIAPIFITVDPKRDTAERLKEYLSFDERLIGLTGTPEQVKAAAASFKVYANEEPIEGSAVEYTMSHSSLFYLADREAKPLYAFRDSIDPKDLAAALTQAVSWQR
ncbi:MAG: SCO family protein [Pseudomonadota bacterium]